MNKKLNIGCGYFKKKGYINVDINPAVKPEVLHNLDKFPYPFKDNEFNIIEADHVLEHLKHPFLVMKEFARIGKKGAIITIKVPHFSRGFSHADHKCGFDVSFPLYFNHQFQGGYQGIEFKLIKLRLNWFAQAYLKKTVLPQTLYSLGLLFGKIINFFANTSPYICSRLWCFWVGGFDEIEFVFQNIKK